MPTDITGGKPTSSSALGAGGATVGRLTLDRNVTDYHTEIEQAAFEPNNIVPGTGLSPDKMLLARGSPTPTRTGPGSGSSTSRSRSTRPRSRCKDGAILINNVTDPVYPPNCYGGPQADPARAAEVQWMADGQLVRQAYTLRARRRLRAGRHPGARGARRFRAGKPGPQHYWSRVRRSEGAGAVPELEGYPLYVVEVGHTDTNATSVLHVPDLYLVVAVDAIDNGVHLYVSEWISISYPDTATLEMLLAA